MKCKGLSVSSDVAVTTPKVTANWRWLYPLLAVTLVMLVVWDLRAVVFRESRRARAWSVLRRDMSLQQAQATLELNGYHTGNLRDLVYFRVRNENSYLVGLSEKRPRGWNNVVSRRLRMFENWYAGGEHFFLEETGTSPSVIRMME